MMSVISTAVTAVEEALGHAHDRVVVVVVNRPKELEPMIEFPHVPRQAHMLRKMAYGKGHFGPNVEQTLKTCGITVYRNADNMITRIVKDLGRKSEKVLFHIEMNEHEVQEFRRRWHDSMRVAGLLKSDPPVAPSAKDADRW